jgi:hypothetical protein
VRCVNPPPYLFALDRCPKNAAGMDAALPAEQPPLSSTAVAEEALRITMSIRDQPLSHRQSRVALIRQPQPSGSWVRRQRR